MSGRTEHNRQAFAWLGLLPPRILDDVGDPEQLGMADWSSIKAQPGIEPDGCLHHGRRGRMILRHTSAERTDSRHLTQTLAQAYPEHREVRLMALLRPHQLDDTFWRMVLAVTLFAGPRTRIGELVAMVCRLTWQREVALAEAERLYRSWLRELRLADQAAET